MASELRLHSRLATVMLPGDQDELVRRVAGRCAPWPPSPPRRPSPGQAAEVRLTVPARAFARYDEAAGCWVRPAGEFIVRVGRSSADLRLSVVVRSLSFRTDHPARRPENAS